MQRYIRLTNLAKPILDMVDAQCIAFSPAVELSYLTKREQAELWDLMQSEDCTPSLSQAIRMKKLSQQVKLTPEVMFSILREEKPNQKEQVRIKTESLRKYFPKSYSAEQMEQATSMHCTLATSSTSLHLWSPRIILSLNATEFRLVHLPASLFLIALPRELMPTDVGVFCGIFRKRCVPTSGLITSSIGSVSTTTALAGIIACATSEN